MAVDQTVTFAATAVSLAAMTRLTIAVGDDPTGSKNQGVQGAQIFCDSNNSAEVGELIFVLTDGTTKYGAISVDVTARATPAVRMDSAGTGGNYSCLVENQQGGDTIDLVSAAVKAKTGSPTASTDLYWVIGCSLRVGTITVRLCYFRGI